MLCLPLLIFVLFDSITILIWLYIITLYLSILKSSHIDFSSIPFVFVLSFTGFARTMLVRGHAHYSTHSMLTIARTDAFVLHPSKGWPTSPYAVLAVGSDVTSAALALAQDLAVVHSERRDWCQRRATAPPRTVSYLAPVEGVTQSPASSFFVQPHDSKPIRRWFLVVQSCLSKLSAQMWTMYLLSI